FALSGSATQARSLPGTSSMMRGNRLTAPARDTSQTGSPIVAAYVKGKDRSPIMSGPHADHCPRVYPWLARATTRSPLVSQATPRDQTERRSPPADQLIGHTHGSPMGLTLSLQARARLVDTGRPGQVPAR